MNRSFLCAACAAIVVQAAASGHLRVNQVGYLPDDVKVAVYLGDAAIGAGEVTLSDASGSTLRPDSVVACRPWDPFGHTARIYMSSLKPGRYVLRAAGDSATVYVGADAYARLHLNELPLNYMRQQRCGYNPVHDARCHQHDGFLVLAGDRTGEHVDVTGGWHDASDYLQYLTTSANAVYQMLFAYAETPQAWADDFDAAGRPGANGIADIVDEARWGLEWMLKMNPEPGLYLNQIADDRDHRYVGAPQNDNSDYGRGPGADRAVYPCSGTPYGLFDNKNRSTGQASSVAKFASSFALGAKVFAPLDRAFSDTLAQRAAAACAHAIAHPGACQTAPCVSPYFYEEDNWADDVALATASLHALTGDSAMLAAARHYARMEQVTPWMGADSARHYQWYPFVNLAHPTLARGGDNEFADNMCRGLHAVAARGGDNVFRNGIPFIWCSNNLAAAYVTLGMLYRDITGDNTYLEAETAVRDWLFGVNPWGQTMLIMPDGAVASSPRDPHSALTDMTIGGHSGVDALVGALVDGPVYATIFGSLRGVHLRNPDRFAPFQGRRVVYHDDYSDYSTNEPTMDGTASLTYLLGRLCTHGTVNKCENRP